MPAERSGPAVCNSSDCMGGKGELINAPGYLQDQNRKICAVAKAEEAERGGVGRRVGSAESLLGRIGPISHGPKQTGERSASKSHATFDVAGAGNVMMAAGLRGATAKVVEHPPEPKVGAPVLDPTATDGSGSPWHIAGVQPNRPVK
jgi:hypothetical protein